MLGKNTIDISVVSTLLACTTCIVSVHIILSKCDRRVCFHGGIGCFLPTLPQTIANLVCRRVVEMMVPTKYRSGSRFMYVHVTFLLG